MRRVILVRPEAVLEASTINNQTPLLDSVHTAIIENYNIYRVITRIDEFGQCLDELKVMPVTEKGKLCLVFMVHIDSTGINLELMRMLRELELAAATGIGDEGLSCQLLAGMSSAIIVKGETELYTKNVGRTIAFVLNKCGCTLPGHSFVEATGSLHNMEKNALNMGVDKQEAFLKLCRKAVEKGAGWGSDDRLPRKHRRILCLHAGNTYHGNTYAYWQLVKKHIWSLGVQPEIQEINLRNGEIADCLGCPYDMCMHYSDKKSCFYGGVIVEQVYPALSQCDVLVLLCPNYNDSLSANMVAFINRLTSLYRKENLENKELFAIVVSGYSGSDIVASQLIGALNFNKGMTIPGGGVQLHTANDPGEILSDPYIEAKARALAERILIS